MMRLRRDVETDRSSDFPIVCETCLGDNPWVKMQREAHGKECKNCTRPFTVFRWKAGRDGRFKKTEICQTCSKLKNACQVCIHDLFYGLPVQVRDTLLGIDSSLPQSNMNMLHLVQETDGKGYKESSYGKARPNDSILKLQRSKPYYQRNRAHICSFYAGKGCTRGSECPYRHEMPLTGELSNQNIRDRFHGVNDVVALKMLRNLGNMPLTPEPPEDKSIRTLYVGGLDSRITEQDIRDCFWVQGEIEYIKLVQQKSCAFVAYTTREGAERAMEELSNKVVIKGLSLKLGWGRSKSESKTPYVPNQQTSSQQNQLLQQGGANVDPQIHLYNPDYPQIDLYNPDYPSMDLQRMGSVIPPQLQQPYAYSATQASSDYQIRSPAF